ncbi:MAG: Cys-tRNA(Pro) deacylase [Acutalibacteraceae bacterium]
MAKNDKTNVMRILDAEKIPYRSYTYAHKDTEAVDGVTVAAMLGQDPRQVFKTLVTKGHSGAFAVFVIPVAAELDLKAAAKAAGEKSVEMIPVKDILKTTGYIRGGCSPIGMKKRYKTVIDLSAKPLETMIFSAGKIGYQVELTPADAARITDAVFADIVKR